MQKTHGKMKISEKEILGMQAKTFYDSDGKIEAVIASDVGATIVAIPMLAISRDKEMGDDEFQCLKKCKNIEDLEKRANCILACPTSKKYRVFIA